MINRIIGEKKMKDFIKGQRKRPVGNDGKKGKSGIVGTKGKEN